MQHPIVKVTAFKLLSDYNVRVTFDDHSAQEIDFKPVLRGEIFGPLRDPELFARVALDEEAHTLIWPNGADFDPATLHNWQEDGPRLAKLAESWTEPHEAMID